MALLTYSAIIELKKIYKNSKDINDIYASDLYQRLESIGWEFTPDREDGSGSFFFISYWPDYNNFSLIISLGDNDTIQINYPGRDGTGYRSNTGPYCHELGNELIKLGCKPLGSPLVSEWGEYPKAPNQRHPTDTINNIIAFIILSLFVAFLIFIFS